MGNSSNLIYPFPDTMVTQFSRKAFIDPYRFLFTSDDEIFMDTYKEYFTRTSSEINVFQVRTL